MPMNPIETTKTIKQEYENYLQSILKVKDPVITERAYGALKKHQFVKGPYLESTLPYVTGRNITSLIDQGIASKEFLMLSPQVDVMRPLYTHQEMAFQKVVTEKRNVVVATGTGSGKTESFLYPILDSLMKEKENNTLTPGVRALLLYPMNALANDQMKRLRGLLSNYPHITFGRYTGETLEKEDIAVESYKRKQEQDIRSLNPYAVQGRDYQAKDLLPLPNERLSREKMRGDPPHILLTNYAMLEYLLIRPADNVFFDGPDANNWKFIVLDEAHTYKGASGTEIALLLRRLKQRVVNNEKGKIRCIATSATLGNKDALPDLADFASNIFDEEFLVKDIITSDRKQMLLSDFKERGSLNDYRNYKESIKGLNEEDAGAFLYDKLSCDMRVFEVLKSLESKPKDIKEVARKVFQDLENEESQYEGLISLIELGVLAKKDSQSSALLPARYHLFVKALEGVYLSLYPEKHVFLDRKEIHSVNGREVPVFELANCQHCGQEYLVGLQQKFKLKPAKADEKSEYYLLTNEEVREEEPEVDSDDTAYENANVSKMEAYELCTACGEIHIANRKLRTPCCNVNDQGKLIKVYKMVTKNAVPNTCTSCGAVSNNLIKRFMTANQPATYVIANSLYSMIPPEITEIKTIKSNDESFFDDEVFFTENDNSVVDESGRKLLVFSDNRQEAAFFAAYMNNKYNQLMWRRLILHLLKNSGCSESVADMMIILKKDAEDKGLFNGIDNLNSLKKDILTQSYLMKELLGFERKQGLEGSGYLKFYPVLPKFKKGIDVFSAEETESLLRTLLNSLRLSGAMNFPDYLDPEDDIFTPRNRKVYFREYDSNGISKGYVSSFMPSKGFKNKRLDYIMKILVKKGYLPDEAKTQSEEILNKAYHIIVTNLGSRILKQTNLPKEGSVFQLNYQNWQAEYLNEDEQVFQCNKCGKITHENLMDICPEFRCNGSLLSTSIGVYRDDPYYNQIYKNSKVIPMISREHTAQLNKEKAGDLQKEFENGKVNVLSCSTTFEMGVDVGQLEAIFLRNVPPETANYVQRAGRAGRRTSSTAFSVTYARRSSHDLHYFSNPSEIISGKIKSPYIELSNEKIADRHLNSIVMAWFFKTHPSYFDGRVKKLIGYEEDSAPDIVEVLKDELDQKPSELIEIIEAALGEILVERLDVKNWGFINRIVGEDGVLTNAINEKKSDIEMINNIITENTKNGKYTDSLNRTINTYLSTSVLNFLASSGVLPKYGFPVDVVKLDILNDKDTAVDVDLSRDLKLAISEYAPGSEIIAAGKIWKSHSLNRVRGKEWPAYRYYECIQCKRIELPEGNQISVNDDEEDKQCPTCQSALKPKTFFIPIFGFSTMYGEKPKNVGESRPERYYSTKIQFGGFDSLDRYQKEERKEDLIYISNKQIQALYSPQGKLVVLNRGKKHSGLSICKLCGYASNYTKDFRHKNKYGYDCPNSFSHNAALGHIFNSDVLKLKLPNDFISGQPYYEGKDRWDTLLYAILEGASDVLGISRSDINGCIDWSDGYPVVILFDEASGGAGHVKHIHQQLESVLKGAYKRVDGHCGCGEETSCYGCLQSYSNQMEHDVLARGLAKSYLEWLFDKDNTTMSNSPEKSINSLEFSKEWNETLELLTGQPYELAFDIAIEKNMPAPDEVGYELISADEGVLGYEAEMVWHNKKIAVLDTDFTDESYKAFEREGWNVFISKKQESAKIITALLS